MGKFYAIRLGRQKGIFESWAECEKHIRNFTNPEFKSFFTRKDAESYLNAKPPITQLKKTTLFSSILSAFENNKTSQNKTIKSNKSSFFKKNNKDVKGVKQELKNVDEIDQVVESHFTILYADGASKGNPGPAGAGYLLKSADKTRIIVQGCNNLEPTTNNVAEYMSLIQGLKLALEKKVLYLVVRMDSQMVINQMKGVYRVHAEHLKILYEEAKELEKKFELIRFEHIPRRFNSEADSLANQAVISL